MKLIGLAAGSLLVVSLSASAMAEEPGEQLAGSVNVLFGQKTLHQNDWNQIDTQLGLGLMSSWGGKSWPVLIAADVFYSTASKDEGGGITAKGSTTVIDLGVRAPFPIAGVPIVPYLGAGASYGTATLSLQGGSGSLSTSPNGEGLWVDGGAQFLVTPHVVVGLEARYGGVNGSGTVTIAGFSGNYKLQLDGFLGAVSAGYRF